MCDVWLSLEIVDFFTRKIYIQISNLIERQLGEVTDTQYKNTISVKKQAVEFTDLYDSLMHEPGGLYLMQ